MLYVPEGFAHGFQTLADDTEVFYQMSEFYSPGARAGRPVERPGLRHRVAGRRAHHHRAGSRAILTSAGEGRARRGERR